MINLQAIAIADGFGLLMLMISLFLSSWRLNNKSKENVFIMYMVYTAMAACVLDFLCSYTNGKEGSLYFFVNYLSNFLIFASSLIVGPLWLAYLIRVLHIRFSKVYIYSIVICCAIGFALLVANIFNPFIFRIDENNEYARGDFFFVYTFFEGVFIIYGLILYLVAVRRGGDIKRFPVFVFAFIVALGIVIQNMSYGISTIWPAFAVAVNALLISLQNELVFRDNLTGLFNRAYFENICKSSNKLAKNNYAVVMMDINGFKDINDTYGHGVGDIALQDMSEILIKSVGTSGVVVRFAGDEFLAIINEGTKEKIENFSYFVKENIEEFNRTRGRLYKLSLSIGKDVVYIKDYSYDELIRRVDESMYKEKRMFHETVSIKL